MRLWLKLVLMVGLAVGAQWWMERNAAAIDEAAFALRCGDRMLHGDEGTGEDAMAAADQLRARQSGRFVATVAAAH